MARSSRRPIVSKAAARVTRQPRPNNRAKTLNRTKTLNHNKALKGPAVGVYVVKNFNDHGPDSLREAVKYANANPNTTITFALRGGTIKLTSGELVISQDSTIEGLGAGKLTVSGNDQSRVFNIKPGTEVTISGLTITEGLADTHEPDVKGCGGGILNQGSLTLEDCIVSKNRATGKDHITVSMCGYSVTGCAVGGGVGNLGTLFLCNCQFTDNLAEGAPSSQDAGKKNTFPGVASGGGVFNVGMATAIVADCSFTNNVARGGDKCESVGIAGDAGGGAIASFGFTPTGAAAPPTPNVARLIISGCTFSKNQAIGGNGCQSPLLPGHTFGGAVASHRFNGSADLSVSGCKFDHNQSIGGDANVVTPGASDPARAVQNMGAAGGLFACGKAMICDSSFEHNEAIGGKGDSGSSGIANEKDGGGARGGGIGFAFNGTDVIVVNCTVKNNSATGGAAGDGGASGHAWGAGVGMISAGANVTIVGCSIQSNEAQGGSRQKAKLPTSGGDGLGGGAYSATDPTMPTVRAIIAGSISQNWARDGKGANGGLDGQGCGGGLYYLGNAKFDPNNITGNHATTCSNDDVYP